MLGVRSQVQIGEQHLIGAQHRSFARLRFLHFNHQLGLRKNLRRRVRNIGPGGFILGIGDSNAHSRVVLNNDLMAMVHRLANAGWRQSDTIFMVFDFFRNAD